LPVWIKEKIFQKYIILKELNKISPDVNWIEKLLFSEHHLSHAASAFYPSPFKSAAILTMDGVGEWTTTSLAVGEDEKIDILKEIHFPHSLGLFYSAFTYYTGFKVNSGEYKLMGLAPYGKPKYVDAITGYLIDIKEDGTFRLNMDYFDYATGLKMTSKKFENLFGGPARIPETPISQKEMDIAASIQAVTEEIVLKLCQNISLETGQKNICLGGGVALNCVANGKLYKKGYFEGIWIQPAAGDAGGALGAALASYYLWAGQKRDIDKNDSMEGSYLGPSFTQDEIESRLRNCSANFTVVNEKELLDNCAGMMEKGASIGWFQGRMEFGPRALGNRSIIGDARSPSMQKILNLKIKYRESFRPFAPSVLCEDVCNWFNLDIESPYMLIVADVREDRRVFVAEKDESFSGINKINIARSLIPAVTHVDYSARIQTVKNETNPRYYALIKRFKEKTGCPVIINTSFNIRGEPIVCTPEDAFRCFMGTELDALYIGNCILHKDKQNPALKKNYIQDFERD